MNQLPLWDAASPARRRSIPALSKSRFGAGLQCPKRLYLECFARDRMDPLDAARQVLFETGQRVGRVAHGRFPGGVLIAEDHFRHADAVRSTAAAMANPSVRSLYEAAFVFRDVRVRVDILHRAPDGSWDLIEVKSSSGFKEEHLPDVAVQLYVLEGSGVPVGSVSLLHIDSRYRYPGGPYDLERLFARVDLTEPARGSLPRVEEQLGSMRAILEAGAPPDVAVGRQCDRPYVCPFYSYCHHDGPEHPCHELPNRNERLLRALEAADIRDISNIPDDFDGLNSIQRRVRDCVVRGRPHADPELRDILRSIPAPIHFLDFETMNPALPVLPGTRPFQQVPFQWSAHAIAADGTLSHREFLHDGPGDPREALAESLLAALSGAGSIVVYSGFEERIIRSLAQDVTTLSEPLLGLLDGPLVDLHALIKSHYYHPEFHGSFSIKQVLPALVRDLGYGDLAIRDGGVAGASYVEMIDPATPPPRRHALKAALRAYCHRDTEAMVRLFLALREDS